MNNNSVFCLLESIEMLKSSLSRMNIDCDSVQISLQKSDFVRLSNECCKYLNGVYRNPVQDGIFSGKIGISGISFVCEG